ncbi:hypothetical protein QBC32DRAFT_332931 [Pseudoneurospora amorphoporcata]|uniref:Senescence domain-containing protein n=1 Tax=Pseudoneurospora amorphoporcata TaxID=241081 RepID=A0AAN6SJA4_9PEZI|nr:hypothetical protein QBC32DRAFT_332931 [Pseudoneurospora amorphoporcata]
MSVVNPPSFSLPYLVVKSNSKTIFFFCFSFFLPSSHKQRMPTGNTKKVVKKPGQENLSEQSPTPKSHPKHQPQATNMDNLGGSVDPQKTTKKAQETTEQATEQASGMASGITGTIASVAKPVTSTLGNTISGLTDTVGGTVGAATRGLGQTVNSAVPGGMGQPLGDAVSNIGSGVERGVKEVGKGVKDAGEMRTSEE